MAKLHKMLHIFEQPPYGWTEEWYLASADSLSDARDVCVAIAAERTKLLNKNARLVEAQVSEVPDPSIGSVANPGNALAVRGESAIAIVSPQTGLVTDLEPVDPWVTIEITLTCFLAGQPGGPYWRRPFHFRGLPQGAYATSANNKLIIAANYLKMMDSYRKLLATQKACVLAVDKRTAFNRVTAEVAGTVPHTIVLTTELVGIPSPGDKVTLKGWDRGGKSLNGVHRVVASDTVTKTVTIASEQAIDVPPKNAKIGIRSLIPIPVQDMEVTPRFSKRDTGASKWVSRAQKRRRQTLTP